MVKCPSHGTQKGLSINNSFFQYGMPDVELSGPPLCYEVEYQTLLTPEAVKFVVGLARQFDQHVQQVICSKM